MSKRRKKPKPTKAQVPVPAAPRDGIPALYERARSCAVAGEVDESRRIYAALATDVPDRRLRALVCSGRAALAVVAGERDAALQGSRDALAIDPRCKVTRFNLTFLEDELAEAAAEPRDTFVPDAPAAPVQAEGPGKVAILSFLFNWPTGGGGNVHTVELARFLARAGYTVRHFYPAKVATRSPGGNPVP
jgi:hypothetical protein